LKDVGASRTAPPESVGTALDADMIQRLASLGYIGSTQTTTRGTFSVADDPKNLVGLNEAFYSALQAQVDGHSESALTALRDIVAKRPDFLAARMSAAAILAGGDRPAEAIALLQSAPGAADSGATQTQLGLAFEAAGNLVDAATSLERAARLRDGDLETLNSLAVVYARLRRFEEGRRLFRQILSSDPRAPEVWNNLGTLELSAGNRPAAADAFRHAVAADPNYAAAWRGLGQALVTTDAAGATEAWRHAVALAPDDFDTLFNLGIVLSEGPQPEEALGYLQQFIAQAPANRYGSALARARMIVGRIEPR
jgi:Flp pilus assembly protein TadD